MNARTRNRFKQGLLLNPFQFALVAALAVLGIVFTIWPEALEHAPTSFEERGAVHHIWHYTLLAGTLMALWSMLFQRRWRLQTEILGLGLILAATALNVTALVAANWGDFGDMNGFAVAMRVGFVGGLALRIGVLITAPTIVVTHDDEERR